MLQNPFFTGLCLFHGYWSLQICFFRLGHKGHKGHICLILSYLLQITLYCMFVYIYLTATRLLEKRREMAEVESALGAQKDEFQLKMESLTQRREELERKELQLKESLLKVLFRDERSNMTVKEFALKRRSSTLSSQRPA